MNIPRFLTTLVSLWVSAAIVSTRVAGQECGVYPEPKTLDRSPTPPEWFDGGFAPPIRKPTSKPVAATPTLKPVLASASQTTSKQSSNPTKQPSKNPTKQPTVNPTKSPTKKPTKKPSTSPTKNPTKKPTKSPTKSPTKKPTTKSPTKSPTKKPTKSPTKNPTKKPTKSPTKSPTKKPTAKPTAKPVAPVVPVSSGFTMNYQEEDMHFQTCPNNGFLCRPNNGAQNEAFPANAGIVTTKTVTCIDSANPSRVVSLTATPTVMKVTEETGFRITINTPGYFFAAVYMKAGTGGNRYVANPPLNIQSAADFLTPDNKGISHIDICIWKP